ncbi:MAG: VWA domain-containing protein [Arachnia sp.]
MSSQNVSKLTHLVAAGALLTAGLAGVSAPAHADPVGDETTTPTMVILDASGSMKADDAPGLRIDAAKKAVRELVSGLPAGAEVGLIAYGTGTGSSDGEKAAGCKDVKTLVPVGPVDKAGFLSTVDGITASGYTPIGAALRQAARDLPQEGPRSIVLVSDGIDTCSPPPPCDVAKEIAGDGVDLVVHAVGFKVDDDARADLTCIADATGGTYADADDAAQLDEVLTQKVQFALQGYDLVGTPVVGADDRLAADIPLLEPGQYVDTLPPMGGKKDVIDRYYRIDPPEGWVPHVAATGVIDANAEADSSGTATKLVVSAITPDGDSCESDFDFKMWVDQANKPVSASMIPDCKGETLLKVSREDSVFDKEPMAVEILVRYEPPSDISHVAEREEREVPEAPAIGDSPVVVTGGLSFNSATEIEPGKSYASSITQGEFLYFKVPMTWGQQLAFRFRQGQVVGMDDSNDLENFNVQLYSPMRKHLEYASETWHAPNSTNESPDVRGGTEEVLRATSYKVNLDGFYYFTVNTWASGGGDGEVRQDFTFAFETTGQVEEGPVYLTDDVVESASPSPSPSPSSAPTSQQSPEPTQAPAAPADAGPGWVLPALGGAVVSAVLIGGGLLLVRKRSRR